MKFITRKHLLDRAWSASDLDAAAEFWLRLYEAAAKAQGFSARPDHVSEMRLRGFPRAEGQLLADELARRAERSDFRQPVVERVDPDTIVLTSDLTHPADAPPVGLGLPLLEGVGFDGLMVEFRVTATGQQGQLVRTLPLSFTMVLVGQVVGGVFVLQTMWRSGSEAWEDEVCWHGEWPYAGEWLAELARFRDTNEVPTALATKVCVPRVADRFGAFVVKMIDAPLNKPRLVGLAWRWLVFALVLGAIGCGIAWLASRGNWIAIALVLAATWWIFWVFSHFLRMELRLWFVGFRQFHAAYSALYREPHRLVPPAPEVATEMARNLTVRKYTADLEAAGFAVAGDLVIAPQSSGRSVLRVFRAPDGATYFSLIFGLTTAKDPAEGFYTWPAQVSFLAHTMFADGGYACSINGRANGYRRKRTGPEVRVRIFPDETDPLEFVRKHMKMATAFADADGRRALPNTDFANYVRRQNQLSEEEQQFFAGRPYTWGDHLRWYLQSPRRVYMK